MAKNKVEISLHDEMQSVGRSLRRVTAAAFQGAPGVAPTIKGKRKSAQFTFKVDANDKGSIKSQARRLVLRKIFSERAAELERHLKIAMESVIAGLVGAGNPSVRVLGRSLGQAKPGTPLDQEGFAKFIKSKAGAGEIGLPDPSESIRNLKAALLQSITVDVIIRKDGPQIRFNFDQTRLLKLTPHPSRFESGARGPFYSWLSLVTGPHFASGGTPGFALVRVRDLRQSLKRSPSNKSSTGLNLRRVSITEGLIRISRTRSNAGEFAAIMMSNRAGKSGKSPSETFGNVTADYAPSPKFNGFWDRWWLQQKLDLGTWTRRVMSTSIKALLRG
jgi:hypothetical protein